VRGVRGTNAAVRRLSWVRRSSRSVGWGSCASRCLRCGRSAIVVVVVVVVVIVQPIFYAFRPQRTVPAAAAIITRDRSRLIDGRRYSTLYGPDHSPGGVQARDEVPDVPQCPVVHRPPTPALPQSPELPVRRVRRIPCQPTSVVHHSNGRRTRTVAVIPEPDSKNAPEHHHLLHYLRP